MATVRPFRGIRPVPHLAAKVAARPYDVLSSEEARKEAEGNPHSFLHVGKPEIDLPPDIDIHDDRVYNKGKENFTKFVDEGILRQDEHPSFYVYALTMGSHRQTGIAGCVSVEEYNRNIIRKHELTRPDKELDRTRHILETNTHSGPILMAYHAEPAIDTIVERTVLEAPEYDFTSPDGIRHQLWVIAHDKTIKAIMESFSEIPYTYIADGHHRSAAAGRAAEEKRKQNRSHTSSEEYNYFLAVLFPHNQLKILEYNRLVRDLNGQSVDEIIRRLRESFHVEESSHPVQPASKGTFGMYTRGKWYMLTAQPHIATIQDPVGRLDVSILQQHVLAPLLNIENPRTDKRIDFVGGIRGLEELERRVNSGEMALALSLYPTSIDELLTVADTGNIMPPKSTWFEPKLRDGMVVHSLD